VKEHYEKILDGSSEDWETAEIGLLKQLMQSGGWAPTGLQRTHFLWKSEEKIRAQMEKLWEAAKI
jgi:hypothetical protein